MEAGMVGMSFSQTRVEIPPRKPVSTPTSRTATDEHDLQAPISPAGIRVAVSKTDREQS